MAETAEMAGSMAAPVTADAPFWHSRRVAMATGGVFLVVALIAITYAKWWPYAHKVAHTLAAHSFAGTSTLTGHAKSPPAPSWHAAWSFGVGYFQDIWIALLAAIVIAAAADALIPRPWLVRQFRRGPRLLGGAGAGGLASLPTMMCTCCTAPLAVTMRRSGVPPASALAYWVGNPMLNPAVLVFLAVVLPWEWVGVRILGGLVLVFVASAIAGRLDRHREVQPTWRPTAADEERFSWTAAGRRFGRSFVRLALTLLPEYLVVVFFIGAIRGWLFPLSHGVESWGILAVLLFAVAGTFFVIPTAGEIPIIAGLLGAGMALGAVGALVIALPALSLPSLAMVSRSFSARTLGVMVAAVIAVGVGAGVLIAAFGVR